MLYKLLLTFAFGVADNVGPSSVPRLLLADGYRAAASILQDRQQQLVITVIGIVTHFGFVDVHVGPHVGHDQRRPQERTYPRPIQGTGTGTGSSLIDIDMTCLAEPVDQLIISFRCDRRQVLCVEAHPISEKLKIWRRHDSFRPSTSPPPPPPPPRSSHLLASTKRTQRRLKPKTSRTKTTNRESTKSQPSSRRTTKRTSEASGKKVVLSKWMLWVIINCFFPLTY